MASNIDPEDDIAKAKKQIPKIEEEQHVYLIEVCYREILLEILDVGSIIPLMSGFLSQDLKRDMLSPNNNRKIRERVLDTLVREKKPGWFQGFMKALEDTGQMNLLHHLSDDRPTTDSEQTPSTEHPLDRVVFRNLIEAYFPCLVKFVNACEIAFMLVPTKCITDTDRDEIYRMDQHKGPRHATTLLILLLPMKSPVWFTSFRKVMDQKYSDFDEWQQIKEMSDKWDFIKSTEQLSHIRVDDMDTIHGEGSHELKQEPASSMQMPPPPVSDQSLVGIIRALMKRIENIYVGLLTGSSNINSLGSLLNDIPSNVFIYDIWLTKTNKHKGHMSSFKDTQFCRTNLRAYNNVLMVQEFCSDELCVKILKDEMENIFRGSFAPRSCKQELNDLYSDKIGDIQRAVVGGKSPQYNDLKKEILEKHQKHPKKRIVVLCLKSAKVGTALSELMAEDPQMRDLQPTTAKDHWTKLLVTNEKPLSSDNISIPYC